MRREESDEACWKIAVNDSKEFSSSHRLPQILDLVVVIQNPIDSHRWRCMNIHHGKCGKYKFEGTVVRL